MPEQKTEKIRGGGFASMTPERQREIASKGGRAAHEKGTAYKWDQKAARKAGRKGGLASSRRRSRLNPEPTAVANEQAV